VVSVDSGAEQRNSAWQDARCVWDVSHGVKNDVQLAELIAFFRVMKGRANAFRFKDWQDYQAGANGIFVMITSVTFQMVKRYTSGGQNYDREIYKPVSGTIAVTGGVTPSVNHLTGVVTVASGTPTSWTGEFDVPARFDTDQMKTSAIAYAAHSWGNIPIIETRDYL